MVIPSREGGSWSLTPLGRDHVLEILSDLDYAQIAAELAPEPGTQFANARHTVIDPAFAPPGWDAAISRLLNDFPFETNVFCMTRYAEPGNHDTSTDPITGAIEILRSALNAHGLTLHLASDRQVDDELHGNVGAYMWACRYGIGLLEDRMGKGLNYNVVIELGALLITGRRCALFKDKTAPRLPTDLAGHIYKSVDFDELSGIAGAGHSWAADDLGLGHCNDCPTKE